MDCKTCTKYKKQHTFPHINPNSPEGIRQYDIDYVYALARETIKKLYIIIVILGVLCVGLAGWAIYSSTMTVETTTTTTTETYEAVTDDGGTAIANGSGEVRYYGLR